VQGRTASQCILELVGENAIRNGLSCALYDPEKDFTLYIRPLGVSAICCTVGKSAYS
jgi:hypothetical protein